jgi:hypothetical protein
MTLRMWSVAIAVAWAVALSAGPSEALLVHLSTNGGADTVTVADQGVGDINPTVGAVTFSGALGDFIVNVTTGLSKPLLGTADSPWIDLNSVNVTNLGFGLETMLVSVTDTGFTTTGPLTLVSSIGGTQSGPALTLQTFLDAGNIPFGTATALGSLTFTTTPFSGSVVANLIATAPFSLTETVSFSLPGLSVTTFDAEVRVPQPGTLGTLGAGLLLLAFLGRRYRRCS